MRKNIICLFIGLFLSFIILEIILALFNPLAFRVRKNRIFLPAKRKYHFINNYFPELDKEIYHTKNSLGFRGPELPKDFADKLSIITVGGSTTECYYLNDDKTWPDLLAQKLNNYYKDIWLNNAGLDGHSTFGHAILLADYLIKLKPKIILFLIGANDVERGDLNSYDKKFALKEKQINVINEIAKRSEVVSTIVNILSDLRARRRLLYHGEMKLSNPEFLEISSSRIEKELQAQKERYSEGYRQRILRLINISMAGGITPVFITQPALFGEGIDRSTGVNLETIKVAEARNGKLSWEILQSYNNVLREVCKSNNCALIDLAVLIPKDSLYFYDWYHFTNAGSERVADILCNELRGYLDEKYPGFIKR